MKNLLIHTSCLFIAMALNADEPSTNTYYSVSHNKERAPFPTQIPVFNERDPKQFNWDKYVAESTSDADRVFRGHLAYQHGIEAIRALQIHGADDSTGGTATRYQLATKEVTAKCDKIEKLYRDRLQTSPATLAILERFIASSRLALDANVEIVAASWAEGSGGKAVNAEVRYEASARYLEALKSLTSSLGFQDLPEFHR